ncbi:aromatic ring-hydroxylating dioxygenase subunit alpha [Novosphingobium sp.]|uniref:aromatic ring-hydroxylating dioxygenase subunit alpha n=1 Tax=Novosphingobium sp. TaxID=1874826 RepID=UPI002FDB26C6
MYPFKEDEEYPRNQWYIAGWRDEVDRSLKARTILGEPIVLYRTKAGTPVAMTDRCPHRGFPLSRGELIGDAIQCGYHGFTFAASGDCVRIPSQDKIPKIYCSRIYPVAERSNFVWIWMGDASLAKPELIPDPMGDIADQSDWCFTVGGVEDLQGRYQLLHDNLLDLSHITFLHADTIGSPRVAATPVSLETLPDRILASRLVVGEEVEGLGLGKAMAIQGPVDRKQSQQFFPPSLHTTGAEFVSSSQGGIEPGRSFGTLRVFHGVTPCTPTTTHYFWGFARNFAKDDPSINEGLRRVIMDTIAQDKAGIEAIEAMLTNYGNPAREISANVDRVAMQGRKYMERQIAEECR